MSTKNYRRKEPKKRNPVKPEMDRVNRPKTFRSLRRDLSVQDVDQELEDFLNGEYEDE